MTIKLLNDALPADAETCTLFKQILATCGDGLHLTECVVQPGTARLFSVSQYPLDNAYRVSHAKVRFYVSDIRDEQVEEAFETPEELREQQRARLRQILATITQLTKTARMATAKEANAASNLPQLVGGTEKQKAFAEVIRAERIKKLFPGKVDEIRKKVTSSLDYIKLLSAGQLESDAVLAKYGIQ